MMSPSQTENPDRRRRALREATDDARRLAAAEGNLRRLVEVRPVPSEEQSAADDAHGSES